MQQWHFFKEQAKRPLEAWPFFSTPSHSSSQRLPPISSPRSGALCRSAVSSCRVPKAASPSRGTPCQRELTPLVPVSSEEHCSPHFPLPPVCHHCRVAELLPPALQHILTHKELCCCCQRSAALRMREREGALERSVRGSRAILSPSFRGRILASQQNLILLADPCPWGLQPARVPRAVGLPRMV